MALGLVGMLCLGAARAVAAAQQPENWNTCAVLSGGDAMGQWVGQRRRSRGVRGPGAFSAGVGVWPHVRMRRRARIRVQERASKPACMGERVRSNYKEK